MINYKGYIGVMEVDSDAGLIHGRVVGLRDVITFQGQSVAEARQAFRDSVDDYLEWCASRNRSPDKTFNGNIMIRVDPSLHRRLSLLAEARATWINSLAVNALTKLTEFDAVEEANPRLDRSSSPKVKRIPRSSAKKKTSAAGRKSSG
jgi:predicted HicB family RNase H-like nuclease